MYNLINTHTYLMDRSKIEEEGGDSPIPYQGCQQNCPYREQDYMISYMVGKLGPDQTPLTRGVVK